MNVLRPQPMLNISAKSPESFAKFIHLCLFYDFTCVASSFMKPSSVCRKLLKDMGRCKVAKKCKNDIVIEGLYYDSAYAALL